MFETDVEAGILLAPRTTNPWLMWTVILGVLGFAVLVALGRRIGPQPRSRPAARCPASP